MSKRRRMKRPGQKTGIDIIKSMSTYRRAILGTSLFSIVYFAVLMIAIFTENVSHISVHSGLGVMCMIISVVAFYYSLKGVYETDDSLAIKVISVVAAFAACLPWGYLFATGLARML